MFAVFEWFMIMHTDSVCCVRVVYDTCIQTVFAVFEWFMIMHTDSVCCVRVVYDHAYR